MRKQILFLSTVLLISILVGWFLVGTQVAPILKPADKQTGKIYQANITVTVEPPREYNRTFTVSQAQLQLNHQYAQYRIRFEKDDTINASIIMSYTSASYDKLFYTVILTDGTNELTGDMFLRYEPVSRIDVTLIKHRQLLRAPAMTDNKSFSNVFPVKKGDTWYLTIGVYRSINETITICLQGKHGSINASFLTISDSMGYYTAQDKEFDGKLLTQYRGISVFGLGFSRCKVSKEITVQKGMLVYCHVDNYLNCQIIYTYPNSQSFSVYDSNGFIKNEHYYDDKPWAGKWFFQIKGLSFPRKMTASVFYMDVDTRGNNI